MRARARLWKLIAYPVCTVLAALALYQSWFLVQVLYWKDHNPGTTRFMDLRLAAMRDADRAAKLQQRWVDYPRISVHLKRAIIAAEDAKFIDHEGFDWEGIQRAMEKNQRRGQYVAGSSTISQQLAKNLFLSGERSLLRKMQEAVITGELEAFLTKRRIFEIYLNVVEWADGVFGAEAAARHYFGISASALNPEQAARLAAMLPRPRYYDRHRDSPYLSQYAITIRNRMEYVQVP
jgi:monofunctional biosynthetic peptidoglycan transglycosylase